MRAWIEVDLDRLRHNYKIVRQHISNGVDIMAVVKADAYGHGIVNMVPELDRLGVDSFAVISINEADKIRQHSDKPILIMGYLDSKEIAAAIDAGYILSLYDRELLPLFDRIAERSGKICRVHLKVETGLNRLGIDSESAEEILSGQHHFPHVSIEAIFSHLANSLVREKNEQQLRVLQDLLVKIQGKSQLLPMHFTSSESLLNFKEGHFDSIRVGLVFYGIDEKLPGLQATLSCKSVVMQVKTIQAGEGVSYGHLFVADKETKIAIVAIGYAEGYTQALTGQAEVLIHGERCKILGKISMNLCVADVTGMNLKRGDEVVLLGEQKKDDGSVSRITATELAKWSNLRHHELITRFGTALPKVILGGK